MSFPFNSLPYELRSKILSYTDPYTFSSFKRTNSQQRLYCLAEEQYINKILYPYRIIKLTFNTKSKFDEHNIIKKLNLSQIVNKNEYFENPLHLTVEGMIRIENNKYYFNDHIKATLIYFYPSDYVKNKYIEYKLNLTIPYKKNK